LGRAHTGVLILAIPPGSWLYAVVRGAGVPAYLSSFTAIKAAAFVKKAIGKLFLPVHHLFAVATFARTMSALVPGALVFKKPVEPPFGHTFAQYPVFHYYEVV